MTEKFETLFKPAIDLIIQQKGDVPETLKANLIAAIDQIIEKDCPDNIRYYEFMMRALNRSRKESENMRVQTCLAESVLHVIEEAVQCLKNLEGQRPTKAWRRANEKDADSLINALGFYAEFASWTPGIKLEGEALAYSEMENLLEV